MKKTLLTALVVAGLAATASAQKTKGDNEFGIDLGYSTATVTANASEDRADYRSGFNAGVSFDHYFSPSWSIKSKLIYYQKGWNNGFLLVGDLLLEADYKLDYLTVPVMANWHFGRAKNWYLNFGPYVGFMLSASETAMKSDIKEVLNTTDVGLDLGIGVKFPVSDKTRIFIELNGQGGFKNVGKAMHGLNVKNNSGNLNIGFAF